MSNLLRTLNAYRTTSAGKDARIAELEQAIARQKKLAKDAYAAWDADKGSRCGKLLTAMLDDKFCRMYRPDLWPAIDAAMKGDSINGTNKEI